MKVHFTVEKQPKILVDHEKSFFEERDNLHLRQCHF